VLELPVPWCAFYFRTQSRAGPASPAEPDAKIKKEKKAVWQQLSYARRGLISATAAAQCAKGKGEPK